MARAEREAVEQLAEVVKDTLNATAVSTLLAHPDALRSALAVAAEVLSKKADQVEVLRGVKSRQVSAREAGRRIDARTQPDTETELLNADEVAVRVGVKTRQSVHDWLKKKKILGWERTKRSYVFPLRQFDERGRPPPGLAALLEITGDAFETWHWMVCESSALDGATPLECLRTGELERVLAAAKGMAQGDFY